METNYYGFIVCIVTLIFCIVDVNKHNKTAENLFPDSAVQEEYRKRKSLTIEMYPFYFLLLALIGTFITTIL